MSWPAALIIGAISGLVILAVVMWRRPFRSFRWSNLDEIDLSEGLLADRLTLYYRGQILPEGLEIHTGGGMRAPIRSLKLIGLRIWNGGFRPIELGDFISPLPLYVPMTNVIGLVSVTSVRPDMPVPKSDSGFPITIQPFRLRPGDGVEVRVLTEGSGYVRVGDEFTHLQVKEIHRVPIRFWFWIGLGQWWRENMDVRVASIVETIIGALVIAAILRACYGAP
jgi:hypothetical protein